MLKSTVAIIVIGLATLSGGAVLWDKAMPKAYARAIRPTPVSGFETKFDKSKIETIVLTEKNTISFNEVVTAESVARLQMQLQEMSEKLSPDDDIILVMNTPGGDVSSGNQLIDTIKALPQHVKTLTLFSASMGFHIVQNAGDRMIVNSGTLMSHRAKGGMQGEFNGSLNTRLSWVYQILTRMDQASADRMHLSFAAYQELIRDEYWVSGQDAVISQAADRVVNARCDKTLSGSHDQAVQTFFGSIVVKFAKCPLITGPLSVSSEQINPSDREKVRAFIYMLYSQPKQFVDSYITNNEFKHYLP